jgi:lipoate-protein ligase A
MKARLIPPDIQTPSMNMAIDEALLDSKLPVLRLYRWEPPGLSIGYAQSIDQINRFFCDENGIAVVRRISGGSAILHERELTYCLILDRELMPDSVLDAYKIISSGIVASLKMLGLQACMNERVSGEGRSAACFHEPSWYELLVNGQKIVGSAQKRMRGKLLQHGSLLIDVDIEKYAGCFRDSSDIAEGLRGRITALNRELDREVHYREVYGAMRSGFAEVLGMEFTEDGLTGEELRSAERLNRERYSRDEWNFMR